MQLAIDNLTNKNAQDIVDWIGQQVRQKSPYDDLDTKMPRTRMSM